MINRLMKPAAVLLAGILLLTGCSSAGQTAQTTALATETTAAQSEVQTEALAETQEETKAVEVETSDALEGGALMELPSFFGGGFVALEDADEVDVEGLSEEDEAAMDRAMRAYSPSGDTLLVNNAETFYYYSQMNKDEQALYDAMLMVAEDPEDTNNIVTLIVSQDPASSEFTEMYLRAYYGMLYDHAELFWLYNETENQMLVYQANNNPVPGQYLLYFCLDDVYKNYKSEMKAFNDATEKFLEDIDLSKTDAEIAKDIHDKLIETVTYNTPVSLDTGMTGYSNLAHTAYGALVADNDGNANYAVCDGYSQAYVYLLQQAGINAALIVGAAGSDALSMGGHAWSAVELDGEWYEVDSTWDDAGSLDEQVEELKSQSETSYKYYSEALSDADYRDALQHTLYNVTTVSITDFKPDTAAYTYTTKDGRYQFSLVFASVHKRASEGIRGLEGYSYVMQLAPQAKGTKYSAE